MSFSVVLFDRCQIQDYNADTGLEDLVYAWLGKG